MHFSIEFFVDHSYDKSMRHAHAHFGSHCAESLIETIISITVIVIGTAAALSMLNSTLAGNELVGQKEIAINLALEGLEALKNIRDTNYLRYPDDADTCWNQYGVTGTGCSGGTAYKINKTYYFTRSFSGSDQFEWSVGLVGSSSTKGNLTLYDVDLGGGESMSLYAQDGLTTSGFTAVTTQAFKRTMTLVYDDFDVDGTNDGFDATVTVTWTDRGNTHTISLTRTIANVY